VLEKFALLEAEYIDTGKLKYVAYPYNLGRPEMALATEAAWCAQDQGDFFGYQHALYENQGKIAYDQASLTNLATEIGLDLDVADFSQCLSSRQHRADVENARQEAANRGVTSTPIFFVNNQRVTGNQPYEVFQRTIEQELVLAQ